jgi:hypothetical protein
MDEVSGNGTRNALFFFALLTLSGVAETSDTCIDYTKDAEISVSLVPIESQLFKTAIEVNKQFIEAAKAENIEQISKLFSKLDGSYFFEAKKIKDNPKLYGSYKNISSYSHDKGFSWGPYVISWGDYAAQGRSASILDSMICTNLCQISNVFERPGESEDLVSRYMSLIRTGERPLGDCPARKSELSINPSQMSSTENPLRVYLNSAVASVPHFTIYRVDAKNPPKLSQCETIIKDAKELAQRSEDDLRVTVDKFLNSCTVNMQEKSLVPAIQIGGKLRKIFLTPVAFLSNLNQATRIVQTSVIEDGNWTIKYFKLDVKDSPGIYIAIPFIRINGEVLIDWSYYGIAPGEILSSLAFAEFVSQKSGSGSP